MLRALAIAALLIGAAGCGDDGGGSDAGGGDASATPPDLAPCFPEVRTCTSADVCGAPCPADKSGCTDHTCFEPYSCTCQVDHLVCRAGVPLCYYDMALPATD